jgi:hypothetical protein
MAFDIGSLCFYPLEKRRFPLSDKPRHHNQSNADFAVLTVGEFFARSVRHVWRPFQ